MIYHIGTRALAGLMAGLVFQAISRATSEGSKVTVASAAAAITATACNTLFMCITLLLLGLADPATLFSVALVHGAIEMAAALLLTTPLTIALKGRES